MKSRDWIPKTLRLRMHAHQQIGPAIEAASNSDLIEALLYLRRASELLSASAGSEGVALKIDRAIADLRHGIDFRRRN